MNAVEVFLVEAMGTAVIDTARTCTVCGERWLDNYLKTLDELSLKKSEKEPSSTIGFRFGDGGRINSFETATIPAEIAGVKCQIITEVIKKDIPLLLSKASLQRFSELRENQKVSSCQILTGRTDRSETALE